MTLCVTLSSLSQNALAGVPNTKIAAIIGKGSSVSVPGKLARNLLYPSLQAAAARLTGGATGSGSCS